jgi:hypothetical protein
MRDTSDMVHVPHDGTTSTDGANGIITKGLKTKLKAITGKHSI